MNKGSIEIRVVISKGQPPRYFTAKTYEEAERKADEAVRLAARNVIIDRDSWGNRPLSAWLDYWLNTNAVAADHIREVRASTASLYQAPSCRDQEAIGSEIRRH